MQRSVSSSWMNRAVSEYQLLLNGLNDSVDEIKFVERWDGVVGVGGKSTIYDWKAHFMHFISGWTKLK